MTRNDVIGLFTNASKIGKPKATSRKHEMEKTRKKSMSLSLFTNQKSAIKNRKWQAELAPTLITDH
jgi:hypothetical protein